jgi:hypothetical protein
MPDEDEKIISRNGRQTRIKQIEARNLNTEIRNNVKTMREKTNPMFQTGRTGIGVLNFPSLEFVRRLFVSNLVLWISDFVSFVLGAIKKQAK